MNKTIVNLLFFIVLFFSCCQHKKVPNQEMVTLLQSAAKYDINPENVYCPEAIIKFNDSVLNSSAGEAEKIKANYNKANALLQIGREQEAIDIYKTLLDRKRVV